jgi:hypothetical protein
MTGVQTQIGKNMIANASRQVAQNAETDFYKKPGLTNNQSSTLSQIANQLNKASQMHKGQADRIRDLGTTLYIEKHDNVLNRKVAEPVATWGMDATWKGESNMNAKALTSIIAAGMGFSGMYFGGKQALDDNKSGTLRIIGLGTSVFGLMALISIYPKAYNISSVNTWV